MYYVLKFREIDVDHRNPSLRAFVSFLGWHGDRSPARIGVERQRRQIDVQTNLFENCFAIRRAKFIRIRRSRWFNRYISVASSAASAILGVHQD